MTTIELRVKVKETLDRHNEEVKQLIKDAAMAERINSGVISLLAKQSETVERRTSLIDREFERQLEDNELGF